MYVILALGKTLKSNINCCQNLAGNKLFDFQQHTYSHALLKTVVMVKNTIVKVYPGASLSQLRNEVKKTARLLKKYLGIIPIGLRGPCGYYRGLSDRPDILAIVHKAGIRFTSTYGRNEKDFQSVPFLRFSRFGIILKDSAIYWRSRFRAGKMFT